MRSTILRATNIASIARCDVDDSAPRTVRFENHTVTFAVNGAWEYRSQGHCRVVHTGWVVAAEAGFEFGLRALNDRCSMLVVALSRRGLDADYELYFGEKRTAVFRNSSLVQRAAMTESDDDFDSMVFEILGLVVQRTLERPGSQHLRVQRIKRFIESRYADRITLAHIARCVGVNRFTCARQFKDAARETPIAYLTRYRLEQARRLLKNSTIPLEQVAIQSGFSSQSYFCRIFKRSVGLTPSQFRNTFL